MRRNDSHDGVEPGPTTPGGPFDRRLPSALHFITHARLFDGSGGPVLEDATIEIRDGRVYRVGPSTTFGAINETKDDEAVIDAQGMTVIPGLINAHEHITWRRSRGSIQERIVNPPNGFLLAKGIGNCLISLVEGVTTIRDCGSKEDTALMLKKLVDQGVIVGPRIYPCGQFLSVPGGHAYLAARVVDSPGTAREAVKNLVGGGASLIKVANSGDANAFYPNDLADASQFNSEMLHAIFDEAHNLGVPTTAHAVGSVPVQAVVEAGADCVEHGSLLDRRTAEYLGAHNVSLVPTLMELEGEIRYGAFLGLPQEVIDGAKEIQERTWESLRVATETGLLIGAGVDPFGNLFEELEMLCQITMGPREAILAATRDNARILWASDDLGTIQPGKYADMLIVDGDPLSNIRDLRRLSVVVKGGIPFRTDELRKAIGPMLFY